ncbi:MAG: InlB B-repeat-containing protein, partial [Clostridiales bacterium]|nr:InlB B-repeat-containing protein [Clostridiales bacterium]
MRKTTTKHISIWAVLLLAFSVLLTALGISTGSGKTLALADEQGDLLYVVDCGRVNNSSGSQMAYGEMGDPVYINATKTFIQRQGGHLGDKEGSGLTRLRNSYTDHPFIEDETGYHWGFNEDYSDDMTHRFGRADGSAGYSEFRSVNDANVTDERLEYKFEVPADEALDILVITHSPAAWDNATINGTVSVNGGETIDIVADDSERDYSLPNGKGILDETDNRYYLTLTFGVDGAQTVVNGIVIRTRPYEITYNLGGGYNDADNKPTYVYGAGFTLADPVRTGYDFVGWYDAEEDGNKVTEISDTQKGDVTLYARWTPKTYTITYNLNGGTNDPANVDSYTYGVGLTLVDPTHTDYTFDGWYDAETGGNKVTAISTTRTGNLTLYARWVAPTYAITYNLSGGTNNDANTATYAYGEGLTLADPTRTGYTFDGWYDAETEGNLVTAISATQTGDVTLYARWTAATYTITYNL